MSRQICPKCKGKGWYRIFANYFFAVCSGGMSLILGDEKLGKKCNLCDGKGYWEN